MATTPNTLTNVMPKILARGLMSLRQRVIMPRLVNGDYSQDAARKGDVVNIPIPVSQTATDVTPAETPPAPAAKTPGVVTLPLSNWKFTGACSVTESSQYEPHCSVSLRRASSA